MIIIHVCTCAYNDDFGMRNNNNSNNNDDNMMNIYS